MKSFMVMVLLVCLPGYGLPTSSSSPRSRSSYRPDISTATPSVTSPRKLTVFEGSNVTFICTYPRYKDHVNVYWYHGLKSIANCTGGSVTEASDKVSVSSTETTCKLSIYQVTPMDTSQYYCGFSTMKDDTEEDDTEDDSEEEDSSGLGSGQSFLNDDFDEGLASLTVLSATLSPPICEVLPSGELNVGDNVSLTCKPPVNSQLSLLAWYDNKTDTSLAPQQITKPRGSFVVPRVLGVEDNLESFTCIAAAGEHGLDVHVNRPSCSITPLNVIFTVGLTPHTGHVLDRAKALFHCITKTLFPVKSYQWHILQGNQIHYVSSTCGSCRYKLLKGGKILAIPEVHIEKDNRLQVMCTVTNTHMEEGSSHWGLLLVERPHDSSDQRDLSSHSHAGANAAGVFTGLAFFIIVAVVAYYIHKKRILHNRCTSLRRTSNTSGQVASQELDMMAHNDGQYDGCGKVESAEMLYEVPKEQQGDYDVPKELPAKDKRIRADQGGEKTDPDKYIYDIPKPTKSVDNTYANTGF